MGEAFTDGIAGRTMNLDLTKGHGGKEGLTTLCTDLLLIAVRMRECEDLGEPATLRKLILYYLDQLAGNCTLAGIDEGTIRDCRYALVALLDETVMSVPGKCRDHWMDNPLQLELFQENLAGEGFFRRLEGLKSDPRGNREVLGVYFTCLAVGFEGRFKLAGRDKRNRVIKELASVLGFGGDALPVLSPHGRRGLSLRHARTGGRGASLWFAALAALLVIGGWWGVMLVLSLASVEKVVEIIP